MKNIGEKHAMLQDSNFRVSPTTSNETSLFLSRDLANALEMHDNEDMEFILTKSNLFQNLLKIFSFPHQLIFGKNPWSPTIEELKARLDTMDIFFNGQDTAIYKIHGVVQTGSRNYFNGLNKKVEIENNFSTFNIRNFLLEKHSIIHFQENDGEKYIFVSFDTEEIESAEVNETLKSQTFSTDKSIPHNRIFFGAPGTGKSHQLEQERTQYFDDAHTERVTFYPTYSFSQFVGTYKPVMSGENISYSYVPGPFIRSCVKAMQHPEENFLLIIEELNRANAPAVFGDVFQLMDRLPNGASEYPISISEDLKGYLLRNGIEQDVLSLPPNLYIWTTMNSADQGVFPLDTAFKRRWDFDYMGIDSHESAILDASVKLGQGNNRYSWNSLRREINKKLLALKVNEDKLLGPFFIKPSVFNAGDDAFSATFKAKVIMYLFEDAARQVRQRLFPIENASTYSEICQKFDEIGAGIFGITLPPVDETEEERVPQEQ